MARSAAHGPPALARVKAAMRGIAPAPGDARSDLLVVVASRLVMNSGQPVSASDVVDAAKVAPADAWVRRAFGADAVVAASDVESALRQAKEHFFKNRDGRWGMKGWPFARKLECAVGDDWAPGGGAPAAFAREKKPAPPPTAPPPTADRVGTAVATTNRPPGKKRAAAEAASAAWLPKEFHPSASPKAAKRARTTDDDEKAPAAATPKRGRGRPRKDASKNASEAPKRPSSSKKPPPSPVPPSPPPSPPPPPPSSNVAFVGAGRAGDVYRHRTYYDGFEVRTKLSGAQTVETVAYQSGDCVYCLPGSEDEELYIGQIDSVFEDPNGQWVDCAWLERPEDVRRWVGAKAWREAHAAPNEVFLTQTVNTNAIQSIEGHALVVRNQGEAKKAAKEAARKAARGRGAGERRGRRGGGARGGGRVRVSPRVRGGAAAGARGEEGGGGVRGRRVGGGERVQGRAERQGGGEEGEENTGEEGVTCFIVLLADR